MTGTYDYVAAGYTMGDVLEDEAARRYRCVCGHLHRDHDERYPDDPCEHEGCPCTGFVEVAFDPQNDEETT